MFHSTLMAEKYFDRIDKGLSKDIVVDGPVTINSDNSEVVVGHIEWYNRRTGHIRVKLHKPIYYGKLIEYGVERDNIVFNQS